MDDLLQLAKTHGFSDQEGKDTVGGLLSFLKTTLDGGDFEKISQAVPGADSLATETSAKAQDSSTTGAAGMLSSAMGMFGSGGSSQPAATSGGTAAAGGIQSIPQLLAFLGTQGVDQKKITTFLPTALKFLEKAGGVNLSSVMGTPAAGAGSSGTTSADQSGSGGLGQQASSFLSSFGKK